MGKKAQGRLVHEIRNALIRRGFKPTGITQLETSDGLKGVRTSGFKVEKDTDSKSARLSHRLAVPPSRGEMNWSVRHALGSAQMVRLVTYNSALEQEGFTCIAINSRDPLAPYSLWRRADGRKVTNLKE